jgi:hypothetical protein
MAESLVINSVTLNRTTANVTISRCTPWVKDGYPIFTFARRGIALQALPDPYVGKTLTYNLPSGSLLFSGDVQSRLDHYQKGVGWTYEYTALGLKKRAEYIPVTDENTKTASIRYNLAPDDPSVILSRQGRTIGQIVTDVLTMQTNSVALNAAGIGAYTAMGPPAVLPAQTVSDLAALNIVPPFEVVVSGERILEALQGTIQNVHPNHWLNVEPDGTIRVYDPRLFTDLTLTMGVADRVDMPQFSRDVSGCYQRVVVRGSQRVQGITLRLKPWPGSSDPDGGLQEDFGHDGLTNTQAKAAWQAADFQSPQTGQNGATAIATISGGGLASVSPVLQGDTYASAPSVVVNGGGGTGATVTAHLTGAKVTSYTFTAGSGYTSIPSIIVDGPNVGARDIGTCTCPSTTTVTITSAHASYHWVSDFWDQTTSGKMGVVILRADAVSGVSQYWQARIVSNTALTAGGTCTLTIDNPLPNTGFTAYQIIGTGTGASLVWRKYKVSNVAIGAALLNYAPYPLTYVAPDGLTASTTTTSTCYVIWGASYKSVSVTIDPVSGHFILNQPSALMFSGDHVTPVPPDDIEIFAIVANGTLTAIYPPDSGGPVYGGTSNTVEGLTRTKYLTAPDWRDYSNNAGMLLWATETHGALSDTVIEGSVPYAGLLTSVLAPGKRVNIAGDVYTTGLETAHVPIVSVDLDFNEGGAGTSYDTTIHCTSRRAPYSGQVFQRPSQQSSLFGMIGGNLEGPVGIPGGLSPGTKGMEDLSGPEWEGGIVAPDTAGNGLGTTPMGGQAAIPNLSGAQTPQSQIAGFNAQETIREASNVGAGRTDAQQEVQNQAVQDQDARVSAQQLVQSNAIQTQKDQDRSRNAAMQEKMRADRERIAEEKRRNNPGQDI